MSACDKVISVAREGKLRNTSDPERAKSFKHQGKQYKVYLASPSCLDKLYWYVEEKKDSNNWAVIFEFEYDKAGWSVKHWPKTATCQYTWRR